MTDEQITLGSLFDGSGGWPLAGTLCGEQADKRIRRLTPLECCRLQGFPDNWCDGIKHSDSAEYKMWGNGMSLPCAKYVMEGIVEDMRGKKNDT